VDVWQPGADGARSGSERKRDQSRIIAENQRVQDEAAMNSILHVLGKLVATCALALAFVAPVGGAQAGG